MVFMVRVIVLMILICFFIIYGLNNQATATTSTTFISNDAVTVDPNVTLMFLRNLLSDETKGKVMFPKEAIVNLNDSLSIPDNTEIDLNGSTLVFRTEGASKCLIVGNNCWIHNGKVICEGLNHSGTGDFQCPIILGNFSNGSGVSGVTLSRLTICTNRVNGNGICIIGDSFNIRVEDIVFPDSDKLARPIVVHWGNVDQYRNGTTHPHDITIQNIYVGKMGYNESEDIGALFISAGFRIHINNIKVEGIKTGMFIYAGDLAFRYALKKYGALVKGQDIVISNVNITGIRDKGLFILGRAARIANKLDFTVKVHNYNAEGTHLKNSIGVFIVAANGFDISESYFSNFDRGFMTGTGVSSSTIKSCIFAKNTREGVVIAGNANNILFERCKSLMNGESTTSYESSGFRVIEGKYITFRSCWAGNFPKESQMYGFRIENSGLVKGIQIDSSTIDATRDGGAAFSFADKSMLGNTVILINNILRTGVRQFSTRTQSM